jgi:hypothetical protein
VPYVGSFDSYEVQQPIMQQHVHDTHAPTSGEVDT